MFNWILKMTAPLWKKALEVFVPLILGGAVVWYLLRNDEDPDKKYKKALEDIANDYQKDVDDMAKAISKGDSGAISAHLADIEREQLMRSIEKRRKLQDGGGA